jgi:hypothetical protein
MIKKKPTKKYAKKKAVKKISGVHKDTKSHNVKINVLSGVKKPKLSANAMRDLKALVKAHQAIWKGTGSGLNELKNGQKVGEARAILFNIIYDNGYTIAESGRLTKLI